MHRKRIHIIHLLSEIFFTMNNTIKKTKMIKITSNVFNLLHYIILFLKNSKENNIVRGLS